jgi:hypothetical protein
MRKCKFLTMNPTIELWAHKPKCVCPTQISHESMWVPYVGPTLTYCGSRINNICGLWMIRAINTRSDGSLFLNDVVQWEGKPPPPHFRSCKDSDAPRLAAKIIFKQCLWWNLKVENEDDCKLALYMKTCSFYWQGIALKLLILLLWEFWKCSTHKGL